MALEVTQGMLELGITEDGKTKSQVRAEVKQAILDKSEKKI